VNNLVLTAQIVEVSTLRYSPAGLPVVDVKLVHDSIEVDSGTPRKINVSIKSVAIGHLAERLIQLPIHSTWTFTGFLASSKNSKSIFFHIQSFQTDS
jgi:primosomal replication protein N